MDIYQFFEPIDLMDFQYAAEGPGHVRMGDLIKSFISEDDFPDYFSADIFGFFIYSYNFIKLCQCFRIN